MLRGAFVASLAVLGLLGCASDSPHKVSAVGLNLAIPKGLVDVDTVRLYVYDQPEVPCKGAAIGIPPESEEVTKVFQMALSRCPDNAAKWCGTGSILRDPARTLTFYVEGRYAAKKGGFTGCVERAVDQDPVQIDMRAQPLIEGVQCGDVAVGYGETCDPGGGAVDEACDGAKCQTKDVILAKRTAAERFFRGRPGRKTGVGIRFANDKLYGVWADQAMNGGDDGAHELTVRRLGGNMITETSPLVLAGAVRLPVSTTSGGSPTSSGSAVRGLSQTAPTLVPLGSGNLLFTFLNEGKVTAVATNAAFNTSGPDAPVSSGTAQSEPHAAASAAGDALIVFVESGAVKSVLRKSDGTFGAVQTLSAGAAPSHPRVASAGADFVVVWSDGDIKLRRVGTDGMPKGGEVVVNAAKTAGTQDQPDVAAFDTGEALVVWRDAAGDNAADIRVQKFDKTGAPTGNEVGQVLNDVVKDGDQDQPAVASGRTPKGVRFYLVAWRTTNNIAARFVKADEPGFLVSHAGATTSEFMVSEGATPRSSPAVATGTATAPYCAIAWADDTDADATADDDRVRARRFPMPDAPE